MYNLKNSIKPSSLALLFCVFLSVEAKATKQGMLDCVQKECIGLVSACIRACPAPLDATQNATCFSLCWESTTMNACYATCVNKNHALVS